MAAKIGDQNGRCLACSFVGVAFIGVIAVAVGLIAFLGKAQAIRAMSDKLTLGGRVGLIIGGVTLVVIGGVGGCLALRRNNRRGVGAPPLGGLGGLGLSGAPEQWQGSVPSYVQASADQNALQDA